MLDMSGEHIKSANAFLNKEHALLIDGKHTAPQSSEYFDVLNPGNEEVLARVAEAGQSDVDRAVASARKAFEGDAWGKLKPAMRAQILSNVADLIDKHAEELAYLETLDNGKPYAHALSFDIPAAAKAFRYYAGWADKIRGASIEVSLPGEHHAYTLQEPVGVAVLIVPWNFPVFMAAGKIAPALAAGCTCIVKPAEETPLTTLRLGEIMLEAGVPDGAANILTGHGHKSGAALTAHHGVDKVSFTGSTEVGKEIVKAATGNLKKVSLELGGKAPNIILKDADIEKAAQGSAMGIFFNSGQVCVATSRLYVHEDVYDDVIDGVSTVANTLAVGSGLEESTMLGPLVSARQRDRVLDYIDKGKNSGADIATGGEEIEGSGYFVKPTVLVNCTNEMAVSREEIFGPVLVVQKFKEIDEVVSLANDTEYGLSAALWTKDLSVAHKLSRRLNAGLVNVNSPLAVDIDVPVGGYKQSGWGRENGPEGLSLYLQTKSIVMALDE